MISFIKFFSNDEREHFQHFHSQVDLFHITIFFTHENWKCFKRYILLCCIWSVRKVLSWESCRTWSFSNITFMNFYYYWVEGILKIRFSLFKKKGEIFFLSLYAFQISIMNFSHFNFITLYEFRKNILIFQKSTKIISKNWYEMWKIVLFEKNSWEKFTQNCLIVR